MGRLIIKNNLVLCGDLIIQAQNIDDVILKTVREPRPKSHRPMSFGVCFLIALILVFEIVTIFYEENISAHLFNIKFMFFFLMGVILTTLGVQSISKRIARSKNNLQLKRWKKNSSKHSLVLITAYGEKELFSTPDYVFSEQVRNTILEACKGHNNIPIDVAYNIE